MKLFVKTYFDKKTRQEGALIQGFKDNYLGDDWIALFMNYLTQRFAENVKPACTKVDADNINNFF